MSTTTEAQAPTWRTWIAPVIALAVFAGVLFVIQRELAHFHLRDVLAYMRAMPREAVLAAFGCTTGSYFLLGQFDAAGLRYIRKRLPYRYVALSSFIAYAVTHNFVAGPITGGAVRYRLYTAEKLSGTEIATAQGFCSLTSALGLITMIGLSLLAATDQAATTLHLHTPWSWIAGTALLVVIASYALWASLGRNDVELHGWELRPPGATLASLQIVLGLTELCVASAVLWWLLPPEAHIRFVEFLGVYALAVTAGILSHVPGGLGVIESVMLLAFPDAPRSELLGALLAYRAIYYLLPLFLAGVAFAVLELREQRQHLARAESVLATYVTPVAPQVIGTLVFLAGVVLLVSGATPSVNARVTTLRGLVPLPVLEVSHLVASVSGVGLLVLARALFRRVHEGYRLALMLLAAGVVASVLKGLDYEEAGILAVILSALWLGRRAFHRRASLVEERFTPQWVVAIVGAVAAVTWIGFFAHRHVEYSRDLWWTFATAADAPRMLRASLVTVVAAAAFLALNLLRPSRPEPRLPTATDLELARQVADLSDAALANAVAAGDKRLLLSEHRDAFIMYQVARRSWVALGDPIGRPEAFEDLAWRFRELADRHDGWVVFYESSAQFLPLYLDVGLTAIKLGEEGRVALPQFSLEGSARAELRQAHRRAARDGATFEVIAQQDTQPLLPTLRQISDAWLAEKATAEKGFSVGAFHEEYIRRFPLAVVRREGAIVAFANLWTTHSRAELSIDLMRFGLDAPRSAMDFLFAELMLWGRAQGYRWFNLGMAPLSGLEQHPLAPAWHRVGNFVFRHGEHFYNFAGLRQYKAKFSPIWEPRYLAAPPGLLVLPRVLVDVSVLIAGGVKELLTK
jgi:phosphatidylglycerol lysyltransferase